MTWHSSVWSESLVNCLHNCRVGIYLRGLITRKSTVFINLDLKVELQYLYFTDFMTLKLWKNSDILQQKNSSWRVR